MSETILVVDDERVLRHNLARFLRSEGLQAEEASSGEQALEMMAERDFALVITDLRMPGMGGQELLRQVAQRRPGTLVLVITAYASLDSAIEALRLGAQDYLLKPLSLEEVGRKVSHLLHTRTLELRVRRLRQELHQRFDTEHIVAASAEMQRVMALVRRAASSRSTVLIQGESGTGKELVARALHDSAPWADKDFIPVNLAAQPGELVDATLFGHERGAYTGAERRREGVFRAARGGTVFLDEISELPMGVQVKLLRVLENREVMPLGADRPVPVDFRLVAASNRSLEQRVKEGKFREDLYFRLNVLQVTLPPLRQRRDDIPPLARRLLQRHCEKAGRPVPTLSNEALRALEGAEWRGNVRELSNVLERALILAEGDRIEAGDLLLSGGGAQLHDLKQAVAQFERGHIAGVLERCGGDKNAAADALGVHLATLYRHLERLGLK